MRARTRFRTGPRNDGAFIEYDRGVFDENGIRMSVQSGKLNDVAAALAQRRDIVLVLASCGGDVDRGASEVRKLAVVQAVRYVANQRDQSMSDPIRCLQQENVRRPRIENRVGVATEIERTDRLETTSLLLPDEVDG